jgi:Flp pilus assembly protein TadG
MKLIACKCSRGSAGSERGQAILEFVPVMILMLTMTFAVVDFGYLIWQHQVIIGLTREGSNLASRDDTLAVAATAVLNDGAALNLSKNGKVIITSVQNIGTSSSSNFVITGQYSIGNGLTSATSKFGTYSGKGSQPATNFVTGTPPVPQPGATVFVTEVYCSFSGITPLGKLVNYTLPTQIYDVAYF